MECSLPVDAVADAGPLSSYLLRTGTLSRGVWVCFSILFSESTQLLKTCLNAESETHNVFQLLEVVKRLEGRPKTENVQLQSRTLWSFELAADETAAAASLCTVNK